MLLQALQNFRKTLRNPEVIQRYVASLESILSNQMRGYMLWEHLERELNNKSHWHWHASPLRGNIG
jgi:hypothetical protein